MTVSRSHDACNSLLGTRERFTCRTRAPLHVTKKESMWDGKISIVPRIKILVHFSNTLFKWCRHEMLKSFSGRDLFHVHVHIYINYLPLFKCRQKALWRQQSMQSIQPMSILYCLFLIRRFVRPWIFQSDYFNTFIIMFSL